MKKYVIIGNGTAAVGTVEGIRQIDREGKITIISDEKYHTYSRPLISYLLYGKTDLERMKYRGNDFYEKNGCECIFGVRAEAINPDEKNVKLEDGRKVPYDALMVATGSRPFIPPMEGLCKVKSRFTFMTLDDALAVGEAIDESKKVLIIGAGLIGLKAAEGIYGKVKKITVVDLADRILPSILDAEASQIVREHLERKGIEFILNDSAASFEENSALLKSGEKIDFDVLIVAVGVRPNVELVAEAGGKVGRGIITDEYLRTSLPDVYAAGDCIESFDISSGQNKVLALLPNAYMSGECAGINMAGGSKKYENAIAMNAIGLLGLHIITAGSYAGKEIASKTNASYKKLFAQDGYLKGFIMIGDIKRAGIYTSLIRERIPLSEVDFELLKEKPQLLAFGRVRRKEKLGGIKVGN